MRSAVLDRHRVRIVANTRLVQVQAGAAVLKNKFSGREETAKAAAIHWVGSMQARDELAKALRLPRAGIHVIGDAVGAAPPAMRWPRATAPVSWSRHERASTTTARA